MIDQLVGTVVAKHCERMVESLDLSTHVRALMFQVPDE